MPLYEEIEIEDMTYDEKDRSYWYPCPCGDKFRVTLEDLWDGEDVADCRSCTLFITVIYEEEDLPPLPDEDSDDEEGENEKLSADDEKETQQDLGKSKAADPALEEIDGSVSALKI